MEKRIRVGKVEDQDDFRRSDLSQLSGDQRLAMLIQMQSRYLRWDLHSNMERVGRLKRKSFRDVPE
ncbi:hypothetical protein PQO03_15110 [Lentisphaera profundi]|uniref:Uncharacterized protein n=1 Tax=Lentisphaera profundi TaxID=1658616 RepID=A0ABY7W4J1_9BACT|nr:hypothetical protein [Lentisphaera profundi]WDE99163.1 hypothetical protein PQO03_15110 [Lentisphaera profundi]